jgi:hypothetical protein
VLGAMLGEPWWDGLVGCLVWIMRVAFEIFLKYVIMFEYLVVSSLRACYGVTR